MWQATKTISVLTYFNKHSMLCNFFPKWHWKYGKMLAPQFEQLAYFKIAFASRNKLGLLFFAYAVKIRLQLPLCELLVGNESPVTKLSANLQFHNVKICQNDTSKISIALTPPRVKRLQAFFTIFFVKSLENIA